MCGICGLWYFDHLPVQRGEIEAMTTALAHRGPDGSGQYLNANIALGHRRLAILDLSARGSQPMPYAEKRYWITYNGEIYNFLELKAELESRGYSFESDSDTEVVVAAYDAWGPECLLKFNGMWAFAIWDDREHLLFLARDRFGVKPLFFLATAQRFAFASEMKAFLQLGWFEPEVNLPVLKAEMKEVHSQEGSENCLLVGVQRLMPGYCAIVTEEGNVRQWQWWQTDRHLVTVPKDFKEQTFRFLELFDDACRIRMRSDVPIGTCLSGGLDSSAVVSTICRVERRGDVRLSSDWQRAFIATFPNTAVDERHFAEKVVMETGVQPIYLPVQPSDAINVVEDTVYHLEEIYSAPPWNLWLLYQLLRKEKTVVTLDGHGGDELLGGYPHYTVQAMYDAGHWLGNPFRYLDLFRIYRNLVSSGSDRGPILPSWKLVSDTNALLRNLRRLVGAWRATETHSTGITTGADSWAGPLLEQVEPAPSPLRSREHETSYFARALYYDFHSSVMQVILRNYDRMSMAHGIEIRMPFLDWRLVTFAFSLPDTSKVGRGFTKLVLREAMKGRLPETVRLRRDKIGFATPLSTWMHDDLGRWLFDLVNEPAFLSSSLWKGAEIRDWVGARRHTHAWTWSDFAAVWVYVNAYLWLRRFVGTTI